MKNQPFFSSELAQHCCSFLTQQLTDTTPAFRTDLFTDLRGGGHLETVPTTFLPILLLTALPQDGICSSFLAPFRQHLVTYILEQQYVQASWNYWEKGSQQAQERTYPNDLDDTFCAASALFLHDPSLIHEEMLVRLITILTLTEEAEGGPYRTWIVDNDADNHWKDIDVAVNANVAFFLSLQNVRIPQLDAFLEEAIDNEHFASPYYPSVYPLIYFLARAYEGSKQEILISYLLRTQHPNASWGTPLATALAVLALLEMNCHDTVAHNACYWLAQQEKNGRWEREAMWVDRIVQGRPHYAGSETLTTAWCLRALSDAHSIFSIAGNNPRKTGQTYSVLTNIPAVQQVRKSIDSYTSPLKEHLTHELDDLLTGVQAPLVLSTTTWVRAALGDRALLTESQEQNLQIVSLWGWLGYTSFDVILDQDERKLSPQQHGPIALVAFRELHATIALLGKKSPALYAYFLNATKIMDEANAWELSTTRFPIVDNTMQLQDKTLPDYGDNFTRLAQRSLGHTVGAVGMLLLSGFSPDSSEVAALRTCLEHFIIARQLSDDAHDWQYDLQRGQVNAVAAITLARWFEQKQTTTISLNALHDIQEFFWHEVLEHICEHVSTHIELARTALHSVAGWQDTTAIERMLNKPSQAAQAVLNEREAAIRFIKAYGSRT